MRLFPRPEVDLTLCFEGARERMLEGAAALRASLVPVVAAELHDRSVAGREGRAALAVRVLGGAAEAEDVRTRAEARWGSNRSMCSSATRARASTVAPPKSRRSHSGRPWSLAGKTL